MASDSRQFFRSKLSGLTVIVGNPKEGEVAPETVRFEAYEEKFRGDPVKVGYLATDNTRAISILKADPNVDVITQKEFEDATNVKQGAKRARV